MKFRSFFILSNFLLISLSPLSLLYCSFLLSSFILVLPLSQSDSSFLPSFLPSFLLSLSYFISLIFFRPSLYLITWIINKLWSNDSLLIISLSINYFTYKAVRELATDEYLIRLSMISALQGLMEVSVLEDDGKIKIHR